MIENQQAVIVAAQKPGTIFHIVTERRCFFVLLDRPKERIAQIVACKNGKTGEYLGTFTMDPVFEVGKPIPYTNDFLAGEIPPVRKLEPVH